MSHRPPSDFANPCDDGDHCWTAWTVTRKRRRFTSSDDLEQTVMRECVNCGVVERGTFDDES